MIILKETTKSFGVELLHTYMVSDDKYTVYGYMIDGDSEMRMLNIPLKFSTKGRTFKRIKTL